ncbi:hypothetical protein QZH41_008096 [Actinostola sp. cb2023]|nr:hypothetical protein QZH41_008096 [Actinostola sp. cb2023]
MVTETSSIIRTGITLNFFPLEKVFYKHDSKLDSKFEEFKRKFSQQESASQSEIKKLKLETKAVSSFKHKGNRLQYEFNVNLLGVIEQASSNLLEGNLSVVNSSLESAKSLLQKRVKSIRFADKSPAGWTAVEEYESDDLADDSEDEKKLRSAEKRALSKIKTKKQAQRRPALQSQASRFQRAPFQAQPFNAVPHPSMSIKQPFRVQRQANQSDKCFSCGQRGHWANSCFQSGAFNRPFRASVSTSTSTSHPTS